MRAATLIVAALVAVPAFGQKDDAKAILDAARGRIMQDNDALFRDGDYLPVIQNQRMLAELDPHDEETWSNLAWMYFNVQKIDLQWLTCRRWAKNNRTYADASYYEAEMFYNKRLYARIPALLEPAILHQPPPDDNAFRMLANSYNRLGYVTDALRVWEAFLKVRPGDAKAKATRDALAKKLKGG